MLCPTLETLWTVTHQAVTHSSVHGISQTRILEWVAIFFSRGSFGPWIFWIETRSPALQVDSLPLSDIDIFEDQITYFAVWICLILIKIWFICFGKKEPK